MKLKTLKDLNFPKGIVNREKSKSKDLAKVDLIIELRQEAIKWIKELRKLEKISTTQQKDGSYSVPRLNLKGITIEASAYEDNEAGFMINWIKHFFNISEEDLKNASK